MYFKGKKNVFIAEHTGAVKRSDVLAGMAALLVCFFTM